MLGIASTLQVSTWSASQLLVLVGALMAEHQEYEGRKEESKRRLADAERDALAVIKADLAEWLSRVLDAPLLTAEGFMSGLDTGVLLCRLTRRVQMRASELQEEEEARGAPPPSMEVPMGRVACFKEAEKESFYARDNASNFISWCRQLGVSEAVLFESEGLVMHRDERCVVLCLLEVARQTAARLRLPTPNLIKMEIEMDQESVASSEADIGDSPQEKSRSVDPAHQLRDASNGKLTSPPPVSKDHSPHSAPSSRKGSTSSESSPPRKKARQLTQVDRDVSHCYPSGTAVLSICLSVCLSVCMTCAVTPPTPTGDEHLWSVPLCRED